MVCSNVVAKLCVSRSALQFSVSVVDAETWGSTTRRHGEFSSNMSFATQRCDTATVAESLCTQVHYAIVREAQHCIGVRVNTDWRSPTTVTIDLETYHGVILASILRAMAFAPALSLESLLGAVHASDCITLSALPAASERVQRVIERVLYSDADAALARRLRDEGLGATDATGWIVQRRS